MFAVIFICGNLFLRIAGKIAKLITRKNFVLHGILLSSQPPTQTFLGFRQALTSAWEATFSFVFARTLTHDFVMLPSTVSFFSHFLSQQSNLLQCVCILSDKPYFFPYSLFLIIFSIEGNSSTCISHRTVNAHSIRNRQINPVYHI